MEKLARCGSPYVAKIYKSSSPNDPFPPYYVMDYVEGRSLRSWIDDEVAARKSGTPQGARSFLDLMTIARQIAEGLAAAHAVDVLHLDLKPENVLLGRSDSGEEAVRLVDFNFLSLQRGGLPTYSFLPLQATLNYTAPEVKENVSNASARSDIYSLGLLILEMATGGVDARAGFEGASRLAQEEPSLAILVLHCLEREPGSRPRDAQHVARRLQASKDDLDQREVERRKFEDHAFVAAAKTCVGGDWFDVVFALVDLARKRRWGEAELAIAVAVPPVLIAALVKHQWDVFGTWRANPAFAPCFVAAMSFTVLSALYFFRLVSRCDFLDARFPNTMRFLMSGIYALPVMAGAFYPQFWPAFAAMGLLFVGVTNLAMWLYARGFVRHSPRLLRSERTAIVATLQGYTLWAFIYTLALLAVNVLVGAGPLVAVVIVLINCVLYWTKVHGDTAAGIWKGLRLEYAIRARIAGP